MPETFARPGNRNTSKIFLALSALCQGVGYEHTRGVQMYVSKEQFSKCRVRERDCVCVCVCVCVRGSGW